MTSIDRTPFCGSYSREVFGQNGLTKGFPWAEMIVVVADAAFASKANIKLTRQQADLLMRPFVRTWRFENRQALKDLVTHWPKKHDPRCWVPLEEPGRRWTCWTYTKRAYLRHIGDVTSI